MIDQLANVGVAGIALLFLIKELFSFLKARKENTIEGDGNVNKKLLNAITLQNENHLHTMQGTMDVICSNINTGNDRVVKAITDMHIDLASRLGEIKGKTYK